MATTLIFLPLFHRREIDSSFREGDSVYKDGTDWKEEAKVDYGIEGVEIRGSEEKQAL